jgi:hypothetical protein
MMSTCCSKHVEAWNKYIKKEGVKLVINQHYVKMHGQKNITFIIYRWIRPGMRNVSDKICKENQNTHFVFNNFFPRKSCHLWDNVQKYDTARQSTCDNMEHALCMLDTWGYKHTLRLCNTYCFPTGTMVTGKRLSITFIRTLSVFLACGFVRLWWLFCHIKLRSQI